MYRQRLWIPLLPPALSDFERGQVSERTWLALQYKRVPDKDGPEALEPEDHRLDIVS